MTQIVSDWRQSVIRTNCCFRSHCEAIILLLIVLRDVTRWA